MRRFTKVFSVFLVMLFISSVSFAQTESAPSNQMLKEKSGAIDIQQGSSFLKAPTAEQVIHQRMVNSGVVNLKTTSKPPSPTDDLCAPSYSTGCAEGDGLTDFAVEEIQNYGSGCADLNGIGWSQYLSLGPATLIPGNTHTFTLGTGFSSQYVNIWIDYNDDEILTPDEMILSDYYLTSSGVLYDVDITIPPNATPGTHYMRAMAVYSTMFTDPCGSYTYGEAEDYYVNIITPEYGVLDGYVTTNTGGAPIEGATISVANGNFTTTSGSDGYYEFPNILAGTWPISCTMPGFNPISSTVAIDASQTTVMDFALTAPTMDIDPLSIDIVLDPFATGTDYIDISNNGDGPLAWNGQLEIIDGKNSVMNGSKGSMAYAYDLNTTSIVTFDVDIPGTFTTIGPNAGSFFAGDFDNVNTDFYYAIDYNTNSLYTIDLATGASTLVGPVTGMTAGQSVAGMACDKSTGIMYVSTTDVANSDLYTIDLASGALTWIGTTGIPGLIEIAIDGTGMMYGWDIVNDQSFTIDKSTAASTLLGALGVDLNYAQGGNWDPASDVIYAAAYAASGQLMTLDKTTGAMTLVGAFPAGDEVAAFGFPGSADNWVSINPQSGTIDPSNSSQMTVSFDAGDIVPGTIKHANINFSSNPAVGSVTVPVTMTVGSLDFGYITGNITLNGIDPYNFGNVEDVLVEAGPYYTNPDVNGDYSLQVYPGTYDVTATLYGYTQQMTVEVVVGEGATVSGMDFTMPCIYGRVMGTVYDEPSGDPLANATVKVEGTEFSTTTAGDGTYELFVEAGTYDVTAFDITHTPLTETDVVIPVEGDVTVDFSLQPGLATVYPMSADYWTGTCTPTSKTEVSYVKSWGSGTADGENGWMKFDISGMPTGAVILGVTFHGYVTGANFPYWSITPMPIDPVSSTAADVWNAASTGSLQGTAYSYNNEASTFAPGWKEYPLVEGNAIDDFTNAMNQGWFAVGIFERDISNTYYLEFDGWDDANPPYLVIDFFVPAFGVLNGTVTELASGDPVEGAEITAVGPYSTYTFTTGADGIYEFDPCQTGTYNITCDAIGYNVETATVEVTEGNTTTQDFALTVPQMIVDPMMMSVTVEPNGMADTTLNISNPGNGSLDWNSALVLLSDETKDTWDLQFSFDLEVASGGPGNAGAECDGDFFYTTRWATNLIHKYDLDGNLLQEFSIPGVSGLRDLAYDGTYFYGGAAANIIYQMDFANLTLVSSISSPQPVRSIAYDDGENGLWVANWATDIDLIDMSGATMNVIPAAVHGLAGIYGTAYDNWTSGGPYLWIFDQGLGAGTSQPIYQCDLNSITMTGFSYDVAADFPGIAGIGGGLFTVPNIYTGTVSIGGVLQGTPDMFFMYELAPFATWLTITPTSGTIAGGENEDMMLHFDATDMLPGYYNAEIHFSSSPDVGSPVVPVEMHVEGLIPATNLTLSFNCTDVQLNWDMPGGATPDSWNVYHDDGTLMANVTEMTCPDPMVMPEVEYGYYVKAVYAGVESMATSTKYITVPMPGNLVPLNPSGTYVPVGNVTITWNLPSGCLIPDYYVILRDGDSIGNTTELTYTDSGLTSGLYEYRVKAGYYFGVSGQSAPAYVLVGINEQNSDQFKVYPNPANDAVYINSSSEILSVRVMNNLGQVMIDKTVNTLNFKVDVSKYDRGIYFISIVTKEGQTMRKIAIE